MAESYYAYTALEKEWQEANPHESFNMWLMDELLEARENGHTTSPTTTALDEIWNVVTDKANSAWKVDMIKNILERLNGLLKSNGEKQPTA